MGFFVGLATEVGDVLLDTDTFDFDGVRPSVTDSFNLREVPHGVPLILLRLSNISLFSVASDLEDGGVPGIAVTDLRIGGIALLPVVDVARLWDENPLCEDNRRAGIVG